MLFSLVSVGHDDGAEGCCIRKSDVLTLIKATASKLQYRTLIGACPFL